MSSYDDIEDIFQDDRDEMDEDDLKAYFYPEWFVLKDHEGNTVLSCDAYETMEVIQ